MLASYGEDGYVLIECEACKEIYGSEGIQGEYQDHLFKYHGTCPKCGHQETVEIEEGKIKMNNYYTVSNTASRLNCSTSTVHRAIKSGIFTGVIRDANFPGSPAYMIPSSQVESLKERGGIKKNHTSKTEIKKISDAKKEIGEKVELYYDGSTGQMFANNKDVLQKAQEELNKVLEDRKYDFLAEVRKAAENLEVTDTGFHVKESASEPKKAPVGKILVEIDASMIQKSVSEQFRRQIANLHDAIDMMKNEISQMTEAVGMMMEECERLEAMV